MKAANDQLQVKRVGITNASTFYGFCRKHDNELFKPIESDEVNPDNKQHLTLLFFRALSYEYCMKRKVHLLLRKRRELISQNGQRLVPSEMELGFEAWTSKKWPVLFSQILSALQQDHDGGVRSVVHQIGRNIGVSCCGVSGVRGETLSDIMNTQDLRSMPPLYAFNIVPYTDKTFVIVTSFAEHSIEVSHHFGDVENMNQLESLVNTLAFYNCEDPCISPALWETLSMEEKEFVQLSIRHPSYRSSNLVPRIIKL
ncbi:hypothetical protein E4633_17080 [Geomonas terrae]|uniref:Uncharacterized protein n=2 Tax=Geomonas terrae TaxID=2562681 RepID=A0A4V3NZ79_9BACT|nr:hypothetical protein E4633_17080 [Geomonas terrae]